MLLLLPFMASSTVFGLDFHQISIWFFVFSRVRLFIENKVKKKETLAPIIIHLPYILQFGINDWEKKNKTKV